MRRCRRSARSAGRASTWSSSEGPADDAAAVPRRVRAARFGAVRRDARQSIEAPPPKAVAANSAGARARRRATSFARRSPRARRRRLARAPRRSRRPRTARARRRRDRSRAATLVPAQKPAKKKARASRGEPPGGRARGPSHRRHARRLCETCPRPALGHPSERRRCTRRAWREGGVLNAAAAALGRLRRLGAAAPRRAARRPPGVLRGVGRRQERAARVFAARRRRRARPTRCAAARR